MAFASGKRAYGICDTCGQRYRLHQLQEQWDGFKTCPECFDPKQPQLEAPPVGADPQALLNPRPDRTEPVSQVLLTNNPFLTVQGSAEITVFEDNHGRSTGDTVRFRNVDAFDGFTSNIINDPDGYSITVTANPTTDILNYYNNTYTFTALSGTAITGTRGGGVECTVGPEQTLLPLNPFRTGAVGANTVISVTEFKHSRSTGDTVRFRDTEAVDGVSTVVLESSDGYTITVVDANEYNFTSTGTATTGDITGGGDSATAGTAFVPTITGVAGTATVNSTTVEVPDASSTVSGLTGTGNVGSVTAAGAAASFTSYTVTVASGTNSYGTGNKFYIDGSVSPTLSLTEGQIYRFDQSDSTNGTHPLRFSTTANGTHAGGSEYTTGVTTSGTPGSSGAYTQIEVASGAPTLYYYCTNHSGMGGQINT
tara:strand:- start:1794 stop:3065 length:1272 start_codon:yes stop_codon:yes gene_type:complete